MNNASKNVSCQVAPSWLRNPITPEEKERARRVIALDALLWIRGGMAGPKPRTRTNYAYVEFENEVRVMATVAGMDDLVKRMDSKRRSERVNAYEAGDILRKANKALDLRDVALAASDVSVCALGAMFLADVLVYDDLKVEAGTTDVNVLAQHGERLDHAFHLDERSCIESAYENPTPEMARRCIERMRKGYHRNLMLYRLKNGDSWYHADSTDRTAASEGAARQRLIYIMENIAHYGGFFPEKKEAPRLRSTEAIRRKLKEILA